MVASLAAHFSGVNTMQHPIVSSNCCLQSCTAPVVARQQPTVRQCPHLSDIPQIRVSLGVEDTGAKQIQTYTRKAEK